MLFHSPVPTQTHWMPWSQQPLSVPSAGTGWEQTLEVQGLSGAAKPSSCGFRFAIPNMLCFASESHPAGSRESGVEEGGTLVCCHIKITKMTAGFGLSKVKPGQFGSEFFCINSPRLGKPLLGFRTRNKASTRPLVGDHTAGLGSRRPCPPAPSPQPRRRSRSRLAHTARDT